MLYSSSSCVGSSCPVLPQSRIVLKKRNVASWKTAGNIGIIVLMNPLNQAALSLERWIVVKFGPRCCNLFLFAWDLKIICCNTLRNRRQTELTQPFFHGILLLFAGSLFHAPYLLLGFKVFIFAFFNHALVLAPPAFVVFSPWQWSFS